MSLELLEEMAKEEEEKNEISRVYHCLNNEFQGKGRKMPYRLRTFRGKIAFVKLAEQETIKILNLLSSPQTTS